MTVGLTAVLIASAALLAIGSFAVVARRGLLLGLVGGQFMLVAGAIAFVAFGRFTIQGGNTDPPLHENAAGAMAMLVGVVGLGELAIGLAMAAILYREQRSFVLDADGG